MEQVVFPIRDVMPKMTLKVKVTGVRSLAIRMKVGGWLIWLAASVMGMGLKVDLDT